MEMQRDYRWDNVKFWLILLVVMGHFINPYKNDVQWMKTLWICIYMFHMPAFFFVAGLFAKSTVADKGKLLSKAAAYFRLYFYYEFAIFVIKVICSDGHKAKFRLFRENLYPWFLFVLAVFLILAFVLKKFNPLTVLLFAVFFGCMAGYDPEMKNLFCSSRIFAFFPFFLLGFYTNNKKLGFLLEGKGLRAISALTLGAGVCAVWILADQLMGYEKLFTSNGSFYSLPHPQFGGLDRAIYYVVIAAICFMFFVFISGKKRFFSWIGTRTMQVYIYHGLLVQVLYHLGGFEHFSEDFTWEKQLFVVTMAVAVVFVCAIPPLGRPVEWVLCNRFWLKNVKKASDLIP